MTVGLQMEKIAVVLQSCEVQKVEKLLTKCQRDGAQQDADLGELACMPRKRPKQEPKALVTRDPHGKVSTCSQIIQEK